MVDAEDPSRPLRWYATLNLRARAHVGVRWATSPIGPLRDLLPARGRLLDWGCGHGLLALWAAAGSPFVHVVGCDIDGAKLALARRAADAGGLSERVAFELIEPHARPAGTWDAIALNDVLYLLDPTDQEALVRACCGALEPGGVLLCAEMGERPRWKARLAHLQEVVAVRLVRLTASAEGAATYPDPSVVGSWMADQGLTVDVIDLGRGYHVPHVAVRGVAPDLESEPRGLG